MWTVEYQFNVMRAHSGRFGYDSSLDADSSRLRTLIDERLGSNSNSPNSYVDLDILYKDILLQAAEGPENECIEVMVIIVVTVIQLPSEMPLTIITRILYQDEDKGHTGLSSSLPIRPV